MHPAGRVHRLARSVVTEKVRQVAIVALLLLCSIVSSASAEPRADWVVNQINQKNASLSAAFRAEKYTLMTETMFSFFRATNYLYWADFGLSPLLSTFGSATTRVWLQGDAHAENIGALTNNQGGVVYDLDDFDEVVKIGRAHV